MSEPFRPYEKLVDIIIFGKKFQVPERNSLLRCFQFISPETIPYGRFCWNQDCQYCRVSCQLPDDDEPVVPIANGHGHGAFGPVGSVSYARGSEGSGGKTEFECAGASGGRWQAGSQRGLGESAVYSGSVSSGDEARVAAVGGAISGD